MDNKLAAILARRKQQEDEDGDMGYYMTEETPRSVKNTQVRTQLRSFMRGAAVNVKSCVTEAANLSGLAPAAFVLDAASTQKAAAEKAATVKETDEEDEEKERLRKEKEQAEKEQAEKEKEEKERLRKERAATEIEAEKEKAKKEETEKKEKERLQKEKAAAEITAEKEKAEREKEKNEEKEGLRKAAAAKAKTIEDSCISNGAELERPSRSTRSTDGQSNFMDVIVGTMLRDRDDGCGSSDTHYHAPAAAVARKAQQRQPQIAGKENSLLPSLEPQDSLPKKLIESSPFRRAGYFGSIPLEANLEIPATKANLESPATHQSQTNSIAKESFEQVPVIAPLAHATFTTDVNLEVQATHRSQTRSIEEIAGNSTLKKTIPPNPKTVPLKSNLEIQTTHQSEKNLEIQATRRSIDLEVSTITSDGLVTIYKLAPNEGDSDCDAGPDLEAEQQQEEILIVKRQETGEYGLLVPITHKRASAALKGELLSCKLDLALRSEGYTFQCITSSLLLKIVRKVMRSRISSACVCLLIWSVLYNISISIFLRELILWMHDCTARDASFLHTAKAIISNSINGTTICNWTHHSMQVMLNHSFFGLLEFPKENDAAYSQWQHVLEIAENKKTKSINLSTKVSDGMKWSILLLVTLVLQSAALQASIYLSSRAAGEARMQLMSMIFGKALVSIHFCDVEMRDTLSNHAAHNLSKLMLDDVDLLVKAEQHRHMLYMLLIHCVASILVITLDIGFETMLIVLAVLVCTFMTVWMLMLSVHVNSSRDHHATSMERIDHVMEFLQNYVDIAILAWQDLFVNTIEELREFETQRLSSRTMMQAIVTSWAAVAGILGILSLLLGGELINGCALHEAQVRLSLPGLVVCVCQTCTLTCCMAFFIVAFPNVCGWQAPLQRIAEFLSASDRLIYDNDKPTVTMGANRELNLPAVATGVIQPLSTAVSISGASFVWRPKVDTRAFRLGVLGRGLNLEVRKKEKLCIVSPKCEGKTSLLCAIAGLMQKKQGGLHVVGKLYFCHEETLLVDGTVKDNILFGLPYDSDMYNRALYCSCLDNKLDQLRLRDLTKLQRRNAHVAANNIDSHYQAAIGLARAVYADAEIYLFDNIFEALGTLDGKVAFKRTIQQQLQNATVIMACNITRSTKGILRLCDRIAVLGASRRTDQEENDPAGRLVADLIDIGTFSELAQRGVDVARLNRMDSIAQPYEIVCSSIWAYKCDPLTCERIRVVDALTDLSPEVHLSQREKTDPSHPSEFWSICGHIGWSVLIGVLFSTLAAVFRGINCYLLLIVSSRQLASGNNCVANSDMIVAFFGCCLFFCMFMNFMSSSVWFHVMGLGFAKRMHANIMDGLRSSKRLESVAGNSWISKASDALVKHMHCIEDNLPNHLLFVLNNVECVACHFGVMYYFIFLTPFKYLVVAPVVCKFLLFAVFFYGCKRLRTLFISVRGGKELIREFTSSTSGALFLVHTTGCMKQFRLSMDALISSLGLHEVSLSRTTCATALLIEGLCALLVFTIAVALVTERERLFDSGSVVVGVHLLSVLSLLAFLVQKYRC